MLAIAVVWVVAIAVGGLLWQRFTRVPNAPTILVPGQGATRPRRVIPLWLVLVLLILLVAALWFTLRGGAAVAAP